MKILWNKINSQREYNAISAGIDDYFAALAIENKDIKLLSEIWQKLQQVKKILTDWAKSEPG